MSDLEISVCRIDEEPHLRAFLREHWRDDHVFVKHPELLAWQHLDERQGKVNFIVAREPSTGEFVGLLGFIPLSQFDLTLEGQRDFWWAIFKVRDDQAGKGIGKRIIAAFEETQSPISIGGIGLSEMVIPIYRKLGFQVGRVSHYYRVNEDLEAFSLLAGFDGRYASKGANDAPAARLLKLDSERFEPFAARVAHRRLPSRPVKSARYLSSRYAEHPYYDYLTFGVLCGDRECGVLILRVCQQGDHRALRIVDYWGDVECLGRLGSELQSLLRVHTAEYVDVYNLGIDEKIFAGSGLIRREDASSVVVPNYFEPFEARNINLDFMYRSADTAHPYVLFKGDADQDRPSVL